MQGKYFFCSNKLINYLSISIKSKGLSFLLLEIISYTRQSFIRFNDVGVSLRVWIRKAPSLSHCYFYPQNENSFEQNKTKIGGLNKLLGDIWILTYFNIYMLYTKQLIANFKLLCRVFFFWGIGISQIILFFFIYF